MPRERRALGAAEHAAGHAAFEAKMVTELRDLKRFFREDTLAEMRKMTKLAGDAKAYSEEIRSANADFKFTVMEKWEKMASDLAANWTKAWNKQQNRLLWKMVGGWLTMLLGVLSLLKAFGLLKA